MILYEFILFQMTTNFEINVSSCKKNTQKKNNQKNVTNSTIFKDMVINPVTKKKTALCINDWMFLSNDADL